MNFRRFLTITACALLPMMATAQEKPKAILVLDGSGSMWGQIDGKAKITIAQEVVSGLLRDLPADQELGLTVYGHREKGNCADIETMVLPGGDTRGAIEAAVNGIKPKGKTPLSAAVIQAAQALRYTEEKATVILVSDGKETCDFDPCAVGKQLEETGVDFTTHVIGFDITDPKDRAELQCLAEETGGTYRSAQNASELTEAMFVIVDPVPEPEPIIVKVDINAIDGPNGPRISDPLIWNLSKGDEILQDYVQSAGLALELEEGEYLVEVLRPADEATAEARFGVGQVNKSVTVVLPEFKPAATIEGPETAVAGSTMQVRWTGPNAELDYVAVSKTGEDGYVTYTYTREGPLLDLQAAAVPGSYEIRYYLADGRKILAAAPLTVTPVTATITPPAQVAAGTQTSVEWTGPNYELDYVTFSKPGDKGYESYAYTRDGSPAKINAPAEPGDYEMRYVMRQDSIVLTTVPVTVVASVATITPPASLPAGGMVQVEWTGPDAELDYIAVFKRGEEKKYETYAYTRDGSPLKLQLPATPGEYDIGYVQRTGKIVLTQTAVTITAVNATITPPATLAAGTKAPVEWTGPNDNLDYIAIFPRGSNTYISYAYTRDGSPAMLAMPADPGDYEINYIQRQDKNTLASVPVTVTASTGGVSFTGDALAGGTVSVTWDGPNAEGDYIAVVDPGTNKYSSYTYTRQGSPLDLRLPAKSGSFEIAYIQKIGANVLTSIPIEIAMPEATLTIPDTLPQGGTVQIDWTGPDNEGDYIAVVAAGTNRHETYTYTRNGSPLDLKLPARPGNYEIAYLLKVDGTIIKTVPVSVQAANATLSIAGDPKAGGNLAVIWEGPDNQQDYIAVTKRGDEQSYLTYTYTRDGSPLIVKLPDEPGEYDLTYKLNADNTTLARIPITVK
jgi:Ca-activated chloride channel family protein